MTKELTNNLELSPEYYQLFLDRELREVKNCFFLENPPEKCERIFMKKLNEVNSLYNKTKDIRYKKVFENAQKKYLGVVNQTFPKRIEKTASSFNGEETKIKELMYGQVDSDTLYHNNLENFEN
jgi:hypothetical protein